MSLTQDIEDKLGLKIENLSPVEKETYFSMLKTVQDAQMTPEKLKEYVLSMRSAVEQELVNEPIFKRVFGFKVENPKIIKLQARLQNYLLLEAFLTSPERAKQQLEQLVGNLLKA